MSTSMLTFLDHTVMTSSTKKKLHVKRVVTTHYPEAETLTNMKMNTHNDTTIRNADLQIT